MLKRRASGTVPPAAGIDTLEYTVDRPKHDTRAPTRTSSEISVTFMRASFITFLTVSRHRAKNFSLSESNFARVSVAVKSTPSASDSTSMSAEVADESSRFAFSAAFRSLSDR